jgi:hypothetical protein
MHVLPALFVWLALLVVTAKTLWKASASSRHKTKQAGQEGSQDCMICLFCFMPAISALVEVDVSQTNMCWAISFS